ncbi:hypothetical protein GCM10010187_16740 [Actinomadura coerulea]|nr:hypothetical protein GCM10010187_16740 [Actinomadura coerulea]
MVPEEAETAPSALGCTLTDGALPNTFAFEVAVRQDQAVAHGGPTNNPATSSSIEFAGRAGRSGCPGVRVAA